MQSLEQEMPVLRESGREISVSRDFETVSVVCGDVVIALCASVSVCVKTSVAVIPSSLM